MAAGSKRARGTDHTSRLPPPILEHILSLLPLKSAMLCSTLSRSWYAALREMLRLAASLDFGKDFADDLSPRHYSVAVDRVLAIHGAETLRALKIAFKWGDGWEHLPRRVEAWVELAASMSVEELQLDILRSRPRCPESTLSGPSFHSASLKHLSLRCCNISPPMDPLQLPSLKSVCLSEVNVTDADLVRLLASCLFLECVKLQQCLQLLKVAISSRSLKSLMLKDCDSLREVQLSLPSLSSLHISDNSLAIVYSCDTPDLNQAYLRAKIGILWTPPLNRAIIATLSHCSTITLSDYVLWALNNSAQGIAKEDGMILVILSNPRSLQFILRWRCSLRMVFVNFVSCCRYPALEKLLIEFPRERRVSGYSIGMEELESLKSQLYLGHLRVFHFKGFHGHEEELKFVGLFLEKAVRLEILLLLMGTKKSAEYSADEILALQNLLATFPKASPAVRILVCNNSENDVVGEPAQVLTALSRDCEWGARYSEDEVNPLKK